MTKRDQSILIFAVSVLVLFALNYFISMPMYESYNQNMAEAETLNTELENLELNVQQGAELEASILEIENNIISTGIDQYYDENYSVHNFFVDTAQNFGVQVNNLTLSEAIPYDIAVDEGSMQVIADHPLVSGQMTSEEITLVPSHYEIVVQTITMGVTGTTNDILDYVDYLAKDDVYVVIPTMTLAEFANNYEEVTMALQFTHYSYRISDGEINEETVLN